MVDLLNNDLLQDIDCDTTPCIHVDNILDCKSVISNFNPGKRINILTLNIRSIHKNFDLLLIFLSSLEIEIDVIVLTECWTRQYEPPTLHSYNMYYTKTSLNQNDGVVVYVSKIFNSSATEPQLQDGNCLVVVLDNLYTIICSYRPPSFGNPTRYLDSVDNLLKNLHCNNVIFTGDININILTDTSIATCAGDYLNLMASYNLLQCINLPTRVTTCIDHFMIRSNNK